jgi:hypothetical protein
MKRLLLGLFFSVVWLCLPAVCFASQSLQLGDAQVRTIFRDQDNRLHVLWIEQQPGAHSRLLYQLTALSGSPLGPATIIQESTGRLRRPHLIRDANQTLHALWQERSAKAPEGTLVHYAQLLPSPQGPLISRHIILNRRWLAQHPDLGVDRRGIAYAVWEEGPRTLILAKVTGQQPVEYRQITTDFGGSGHGYPVLAVDRHGDLHLAWSAITTAGTQQTLYASLSSQAFNTARLSGQVVHTSSVPVDQPKQIRVADQTGQVTIRWMNKHGQGPAGRLVASSGSVTFRRHGKTISHLTIRDSTLTASAEHWQPIMPLAVTSKPLLIQPAVSAAAVLPPAPRDVSRAAVSRFDGSIAKLKLAWLLAFTSWSGAPPAPGIVTASFIPPVLAVVSTSLSTCIHTVHYSVGSCLPGFDV